MHLAIVVPYSLDVPGGVGRHALGQAQWFAQQGWQVTVVAPGTGPPPSLPGVEVVLVGGASAWKFNGSVAHLALRPRQSRAATSVIRNADVVHVHEPLTPGIAFSCAKAAERLLITHHASFTPARAVELICWRRARMLGDYEAVAVSQAARKTAMVLTGQDIDVVPNAIVIPEPPKEEPGWRGGSQPRIVFVGRAADPRKGFADFQELAERLAESASFVALGPGTEAGQPPVEGKGEVNEAQRLHVLHTSDLLVAPNRHGESFGLVLAEALAAGCSVAASDLPGFRETLHGLVGTGLAELFPVGDLPSALAAVNKLISQPGDRSAAFQHAQTWSWERVGPQLMDRLAQLAAR